VMCDSIHNKRYDGTQSGYLLIGNKLGGLFQ